MKASSVFYESYAVGVSCAEAASWTRQLAGRKLAAIIGSEAQLGGIPGFTCYAYPDMNGYAYAGTCTKKESDTLFGWNFNEETIPTYFEPGLAKPLGGASDAQVAIRNLGHGHYQLSVQNASPKGSITGFTWAPPAGMTITAVTGSNGGTCRLASHGAISCRGTLQQPKCLCNSTGGTLTVEFTANQQPYRNSKSNYETLGTLNITSLTPVPRLVPSTPQQEQAQRNI
jgi:hypothetical protein